MQVAGIPSRSGFIQVTLAFQQGGPAMKHEVPGARLHARAPIRRKATTASLVSRVVIPMMALALSSCSNKTNVSKAESGASRSDMNESSGVSALGKATFSALIDGQRVSGGAIDEMQQQNAAHTIPGSGTQPEYLLFYLFDTKEPNDPHFGHSFRVYVPKQVGPASNAHLTLNVILDSDHAAIYNSSTPSIAITSLTATRVSGTFSAKMSLSPDTPNAPKKEVTVTEGQFDIPMATSTIVPP